MSDLAVTILIFTIPTLLGYLVLSLLFRKDDFIFGVTGLVSLSFGLGMAFIPQVMLVLGWDGWLLNGFTVNAVLLLIIILLFVLNFKKKTLLEPNDVALRETPVVKSSWLLRLIIAILFYGYVSWVFFYVFVNALIFPLFAWDSFATSIFASKVFFYHQSLELHPFVPHASFPLQIPLSALWVNLMRGAWDDQLFKILFPTIFVCQIIINYDFMKFFTDTLWARIGVLFLLSSSFFIAHASLSYRDVWLQFYTSLSLMLLFVWFKTDKKPYLLVSSLAAGMATFVKLEGTAYLLIIFLLAFYVIMGQKKKVKEKITNLVLFIFPATVYYGIYYFYKISREIPINEKAQLDLSHVSAGKMLFIVKCFFGEMFLSPNWNILYFTLVVAIILRFKKIQKDLCLQVLSIGLILFLGLYFCVALMTSNFGDLLSRATLSRIFLHFFPLVVWLIIFLYSPYKICEKAS